MNQDWHVSSIFSDGAPTVSQYVHRAEAIGLRSLCVVDRARRSSPWIRDLAEACRIADGESEVEVRSGIEIEILDTRGSVELPPFASRVDYIYLAAKRLPTPGGPLEAAAAREQIEAGELLPARAVEWLTRAYANATRREGSPVLAHPFSLLPQIGIDPQNVHPAYLHWLAGTMKANGAGAEVSETWRAPSPPVVDRLITAGVPVLPASGARAVEELGRTGWYQGALAGLSSLARAA